MFGFGYNLKLLFRPTIPVFEIKVTLNDTVSVHPLISVTVTEYKPFVSGVIVEVVAPVFHK